MKKVNSIFKHILFFATLVLMVGACNTLRLDSKRIDKAQGRNPSELRNKCILYYPTKDSSYKEIIYKEGKTDTILDYVEINCDTIFPTKVINKLVKVPITKYIKHNDTLIDHQYIVQVDTREIDRLNEELSKKDNIISTITQEKKSTTKARNLLWLALAISVAIHALRLYFNR